MEFGGVELTVDSFYTIGFKGISKPRIKNTLRPIYQISTTANMSTK